MDTVQDLKPATARKVFLGQMAFLAVMLSAIAVSNVFTAIADRANEGVHLAAWEPITWEFSSVLCIWLLLPAMGWWLGQFPLVHGGWLRNLPAHLIATLPFSLVHVGGMTVLRELIYKLMGGHYHLGPWWPNCPRSGAIRPPRAPFVTLPVAARILEPLAFGPPL